MKTRYTIAILVTVILVGFVFATGEHNKVDNRAMVAMAQCDNYPPTWALILLIGIFGAIVTFSQKYTPNKWRFCETKQHPGKISAEEAQAYTNLLTILNSKES